MLGNEKLFANNSQLPILIARELEIIGPKEVCQNSTETYVPNYLNLSPYTIKLINNQNVQVNGNQIGTNSMPFAFSYPPGQYTLRFVAAIPGFFCNPTFDLPITIQPSPPALTAINGSTYVCDGLTYGFSAVPTNPDYFIEWSAPAATPSSASGDNAAFVWSAANLPATLTVTQRIKAAPNCPSPPYTVTITDKGNQPQTFALVNGSNALNCVADYATPVVADDYTWFIGNGGFAGSISAGQSTPNATVQWNYNGGNTTITTLNLQTKTCGNVNQTVSVPITLNQLLTPNIGAMPTSFTVCENQLLTVPIANANLFSGGQFVWTVNGITTTGSKGIFNFPTAGTYTLEVQYVNTAAPNCVSPVASATITVNPTPAIFVSSPTNLDLNTKNPVPLFATVSNANNQIVNLLWNTGATTQAISVSNVGGYSCVATNSFGCSATSNAVAVTNTTPPGGAPPFNFGGGSGFPTNPPPGPTSCFFVPNPKYHHGRHGKLWHSNLYCRRDRNQFSICGG